MLVEDAFRPPANVDECESGGSCSTSVAVAAIAKMSLCLASSVKRNLKALSSRASQRTSRQVALGRSRRTEEEDMGFCR